MEPLADLLLVAFLPIVIGAVALSWLSFTRADDAIGHFGHAYVLGAWLLSAFLFLGLACGLTTEVCHRLAIGLGCVAAIGTGVLWIRSRDSRRPVVPAADATQRHDPTRWFWRGVLLLTLVVVVFRAAAASARFVVVGDEANIWAMKAKAIYVAGGFNERLVELLKANGVFHADYPLWNPLLQLWTFLQFGRITDFENRVPIQLFWVALMLILVGELRRSGTRLSGVLLVLFVTSATVLDMTASAYADVMVATGFAMSMIAWRRFADSNDPRWRGLFFAALGVLAWSKNEGSMLAIAALLGAGVELARRRDLRRHRLTRAELVCIGCAVAVWVGQRAFNANHDLVNDIVRFDDDGVFGLEFLTRAFESSSARIGVIANGFLQHGVLAARETNGVFIAALVAAASFPRLAWRSSTAEVVALLCALAGITVVYLGTPNDVAWQIKWSLERLLLQIAPVALLLTARILKAANPVDGAAPTTGAAT